MSSHIINFCGRNMASYSRWKFLFWFICSAYSFAPAKPFLLGHNFHFISISNNLNFHPHNQLKNVKYLYSCEKVPNYPWISKTWSEKYAIMAEDELLASQSWKVSIYDTNEEKMWHP